MTPSWDKTSNDEVLIFTYILFHHELTFKSHFCQKRKKSSDKAILFRAWNFNDKRRLDIILNQDVENTKTREEHCGHLVQI